MFRSGAISLAGMAVLAGAVTSGHASEVNLVLPGEQEVEEIRVDYDCGAFQMTVDCVNAGPVSLAVFVVDDRPVVASNVISGSGARYAGDAFVWWTKGKTASLFDLAAGEDAPPRAECEEISG